MHKRRLNRAQLQLTLTKLQSRIEDLRIDAYESELELGAKEGKALHARLFSNVEGHLNAASEGLRAACELLRMFEAQERDRSSARWQTAAEQARKKKWEAKWRPAGTPR